jgi:hypothetical protein
MKPRTRRASAARRRVGEALLARLLPNPFDPALLGFRLRVGEPPLLAERLLGFAQGQDAGLGLVQQAQVLYAAGGGVLVERPRCSPRKNRLLPIWRTRRSREQPPRLSDGPPQLVVPGERLGDLTGVGDVLEALTLAAGRQAGRRVAPQPHRPSDRVLVAHHVGEGLGQLPLSLASSSLLLAAAALTRAASAAPRQPRTGRRRPPHPVLRRGTEDPFRTAARGRLQVVLLRSPSARPEVRVDLPEPAHGGEPLAKLPSKLARSFRSRP